MDVTDILPQLERLDGEIDDLEDALEPLLRSLPEVASKLPLLDKSKLYVLVAYALESMIFCKNILQTQKGVLTDKYYSFFTPQWCKRQGASSLQGTDKDTTIF